MTASIYFTCIPGILGDLQGEGPLWLYDAQLLQQRQVVCRMPSFDAFSAEMPKLIIRLSIKGFEKFI
jgi:hypothetical protein